VKSKAYLFSAFVSFLFPFCLYWFTKSDSLGFADAGEFAIVTKIAGIAHPPGFPSYVITGWLFSKAASLLSINHVLAMVLFSVLCTSLASLLLFLTCTKLLASVSGTPRPENNFPVILSALGASLSFATGYTIWHWANSVEVYAFHLLSFAFMIYGLVLYNLRKDFRFLIMAAVGAAMALANHHLTVIFFLPFIPFFFTQDFLTSYSTVKKSKKATESHGYFNALKKKEFSLWVIITVAIITVFYGWMYFRAGQDMPFKFGQPDNFSRLIYHLAGGAWQKNTVIQTEGLIGLRFPYFSMLLVKHLLLFLPFAIMGFVFLFRKNLKKPALMVIIYFLLLFIYQLRIDQTADTDAYLLLPFFCLGIPVSAGIYSIISKWKWTQLLVPALAAIQTVIFFPIQNKKTYNVSESLMRQLDECTPQNAVLLISDWTLVSQYHYYRFGENFRPDLILLNYDLKFTNWKLLPHNYPRLYSYIRHEYDRFVELLGKVHPQEIFNTGCTLNTPELMNAYLNTVLKIKEYCRQNNYAFMSDPRAYLFLNEHRVFGPESHMSGMLVSDKATGLGKSFLELPFKWLHSKQLLSEPASTDKLVDFEAALDFSRNYYKLLNDSVAYNTADNSYHFIKNLQKKLKENMPFVFRPRNE
jgi:hypothetical protein